MNNTYCAIWLWVQRKTMIVSGNTSLPVWIEKHRNIYRIMHELSWITMFGHEWGDLPMCENHWQIASRVGKKSLVAVTNVLFYFLHTVLCLEYTIPPLRHYCEGGLFWLNIVTSPELIYDVTWKQCFGIVTSYSSIVVVRTNWRKGDLRQ